MLAGWVYQQGKGDKLVAYRYKNPVQAILMALSWIPAPSQLCPFPNMSSRGRGARCFWHRVFWGGYPDPCW